MSNVIVPFQHLTVIGCSVFQFRVYLGPFTVAGVLRTQRHRENLREL